MSALPQTCLYPCPTKRARKLGPEETNAIVSAEIDSSESRFASALSTKGAPRMYLPIDYRFKIPSLDTNITHVWCLEEETLPPGNTAQGV